MHLCQMKLQQVAAVQDRSALLAREGCWVPAVGRLTAAWPWGQLLQVWLQLSTKELTCSALRLQPQTPAALSAQLSAPSPGCPAPHSQAHRLVQGSSTCSIWASARLRIARGWQAADAAEAARPAAQGQSQPLACASTLGKAAVHRPAIAAGLATASTGPQAPASVPRPAEYCSPSLLLPGPSADARLLRPAQQRVTQGCQLQQPVHASVRTRDALRAAQVAR